MENLKSFKVKKDILILWRPPCITICNLDDEQYATVSKL